MDVQKLYNERFSTSEIKQKQLIWTALNTHFFQQFIALSDTVIDIGAGYCEFINSIQCKTKIAVDINPELKTFANKNIIIAQEKSTNMTSINDNSVDVVFMSNFLEHLRSKEEVLQTFAESRRILKPQSKIIILQPNIRFLHGQYWDFFDHHTPLSDLSLCEALKLTGFSIVKCYPKFLPFTTKSKLPKNTFFVKAYLKVPFLWNFFGKQCCVIAQKLS